MDIMCYSWESFFCSRF